MKRIDSPVDETETALPGALGSACAVAEDVTLVRRVALRDDQAFEELFKMHGCAIRGLARRILKENREAEEILQETFEYVWRRARDYDLKRGSVLSWLVILCRSRALDRLRAQRTAQHALSKVAVDAEVLQAPLELNPKQRLRDQMQKALRSLPQEQLVALEMSFYEGLSHSEISLALSVPLGTVKTRIRRAMERLAAILREPELT